MSAYSSSLIPAVLARLGPFEPDSVVDLRPYLESVPDPRSLRGRWYCLTAILLVCACAVVSGAKSIDELAEWGARAGSDLLERIGVRWRLLHWRRSPWRATIGRVPARLDGDTVGAAIGAYLTNRHRTIQPTTDETGARQKKEHRLAIAVHGKALKGSARLNQKRRHLLSAVTHNTPVTLAQAEIGAKTGET